MSFFDPQNPGIGGLDELTDAETTFIQGVSALSYAQGDILYYNGTVLTRLAAGTNGHFLKTQGAGANPVWAVGSATVATLDDVTDVVITSNAQGDILYRNGSSQWVNLAPGAAGTFLKSQGAAANPVWDTPTASAGGSDTYVQFNDGGTTIGGDAGFTYNKTTDVVSSNGGFRPVTNDTGALGSATLSFADLFLASGGVINFGNGEVTLTSAANTLTLAGGDLAIGANSLTMTGSLAATGARVTKGWFTDVESTNMITIGGTSLADVAVTFTTKTIALGSNTVSGTKAQFDTAVTDDNFAYLATAQSFTALQTYTLAGNPTRNVNTTDGASVQAAKFEGDRATMAANDEAYVSFHLSDSAGNQDEMARITWKATTVTSASEVSRLQFGVVTAGTLADEVYLTSTALSPAANDGNALGTTALQWSDLFLAEGGVINWDNADVTITQTNNVLAFAGAAYTFDGAVGPSANDGAALGSSTVSWADLFLASGAVVNFANGDAAITHSTGILTVSTGDLRVTTAGTNAASVVTVGGTQTLTSKTLTSPTLTTPSAFTTGGTITLAEGHSIAYDPTLSADGTFTGITITGTAGATLAFGDLIYLAVADSRWELADADAVGTSGTVLIGMCVLAAAADASATTILLNGHIRADTAFPALTVGAAVYAGETAGDVQVAIPTGADNVIRVVGFATTADSMYFNPSQDHQTTVA